MSEYLPPPAPTRRQLLKDIEDLVRENGELTVSNARLQSLLDQQDNVSTFFAIRVLRDALLAYMEPAGETPEQLRKRAKSALHFAQKALPLERHGQ